jgi:uncharacterized membrane protein YjjP (DUF1212 family)
MDYYALLDLTIRLGYRLAMNGAETFRVEESINRIFQAYGIEAEAFAITNCLTVSIKTENGKPMTRMRRIGDHGNDLDSVERYSNLSRRICAETPEPNVALQWLLETDKSRRSYSVPVHLIGNFMGAAGFAIMFGSTFFDSFISGLCGIIVGIVGLMMSKLKANQFFRIILASFLMAIPAYTLASCGAVSNADTVVIGALMLLVPGLLFTNAMRDIINGDTNSGLNRIIQVFLIAVAIALGTGAGWGIVSRFLTQPDNFPILEHTFPIHLIASFVGCVGFSIIFNIHGPGGLLCALGGVLVWAIYLLIQHFGGSDLFAYFWATVFASGYAEVMARVRKYPAISYLVVSIFPLIPGASVYYTMTHAVRGDMESFASQGMHTIAIAGVMAVGILLVSTGFRIWSLWKRSRAK